MSFLSFCFRKRSHLRKTEETLFRLQQALVRDPRPAPIIRHVTAYDAFYRQDMTYENVTNQSLLEEWDKKRYKEKIENVKIRLKKHYMILDNFVKFCLAVVFAYIKLAKMFMKLLNYEWVYHMELALSVVDIAPLNIKIKREFFKKPILTYKGSTLFQTVNKPIVDWNDILTFYNKLEKRMEKDEVITILKIMKPKVIYNKPIKYFLDEVKEKKLQRRKIIRPGFKVFAFFENYFSEHSLNGSYVIKTTESKVIDIRRIRSHKIVKKPQLMAPPCKLDTYIQEEATKILNETFKDLNNTTIPWLHSITNWRVAKKVEVTVKEKQILREGILESKTQSAQTAKEEKIMQCKKAMSKMRSTCSYGTLKKVEKEFNSKKQKETSYKELKEMATKLTSKKFLKELEKKKKADEFLNSLAKKSLTKENREKMLEKSEEDPYFDMNEFIEKHLTVDDRKRHLYKCMKRLFESYHYVPKCIKKKKIKFAAAIKTVKTYERFDCTEGKKCDVKKLFSETLDYLMNVNNWSKNKIKSNKRDIISKLVDYGILQCIDHG